MIGIEDIPYDIKETSYRSGIHDMVRIECTMRKNDWRRLKRRIRQITSKHRPTEPEQQKED